MPWLWRRKDRDAAPVDSPAARPPGPVADADAGDDVIREERPPTGDWMTLPPLATTPSIPPTFRVQTLPDILTSHQSPRVSGTLGHAVSSEAPSGIVRGLATGSGAGRPAEVVAPDLTLRTPHVAPPEEELAPAPRPLPVASPEPLPVSRLPEPTVSRSLADPLPLASPVTAGREVPVARVVDAPVLRPAAPTTDATAAAEASAPPSSTAPVAPTDDRTGGFDLSALDEPTADAVAELRAPQPHDLAPPIQPRAIQRRLAGARPLEVPPHLLAPSDASPTAGTPLDLPLRQPPSGPDSGDLTLAGSSAPAVTGPDAPPEASAATDTGGAADLAPTSPSAPGTGATLQRSADAATPPATAPLLGSTDGDAGTTEAGAASGSATATAGASSPLDLPLHRPAPAAPDSADGEPTSEGSAGPVGAAAPLTSVQPLSTSVPAPGGGAPEGSGGPTAAPAPAADLPLVAPRPAAETGDLPVSRLRDGGASTAAPAAPIAEAVAATTSGSGSTDAGSDGAAPPADQPEQTLAPTIGTLGTTADGEPLTTSGAATRTQAGPSVESLPLAPADWQETLDAPAALPPRERGPSDTAMSLGGAAAPTGLTTSLPIQRSAGRSAPVAPSGAALPLVSRPLGVDRSLATLSSLTPATTSSAQRQAAASAAPLTPSSTLHRAGRSVPADGPMLRAVETAPLPEVITPEFLLATPLPAAAPTDGEHGVGSDLPLQRAAGPATTAPSPASSSSSSSPLPLHTPAASVPTAEDVAVRAGLAERGPDGGLLLPHPPAGSDLGVQRALFSGLDSVREAASTASSTAASVASDASSTASSVAGGVASVVGAGRDIVSSISGALSPEPTQQEAAQQLADQARKLYPHIRHHLESDIRRQLEARSRGDRSRP